MIKCNVILDWIWKQRKDVSGETVKIQTKSLAS